jgi:hypothetical protein
VVFELHDIKTKYATNYIINGAAFVTNGL